MSDLRRLSPRRSRLRRLAPLVVWPALLALLAALWFAGAWYLRIRALDWSVRFGVALQNESKSPAELAAALQRWEQETARYWRDRPGVFAKRIFDRHALTDANVRRLLARVTGADYGENLDSWRRWLEGQLRLARGELPAVPVRERVRLDPLWSAPVGLTHAFSTILPIDGEIFVASCGRGFDAPGDDADGVVRVDAKSGQASYLFEPRDSGPRDIIGLCATDGMLFAACRNGLVYGLSFAGQLKWKASAGAKLSSTPIIFDSGERVTLVAVLTETGQVVAFNVDNGRTVWVADAKSAGVNTLSKAAQRIAPYPRLAATLALGDLLDDARPELVVISADGDWRVLAGNGRVLFKREPHPGGLAGAVLAGTPNTQPPAFSADLEGGVWSIYRAERGLQFAPLAQLNARDASGVVAPLRLVVGRDPAPEVLVCLTGAANESCGALALLHSSGLRWRFPLPGVVWGAPAVADLNGDGRPELIATSFGQDVSGKPAGWLDVVSRDGHCLLRGRLPAPCEGGPVVADVDGDGRVEILVADNTGMLHCYRGGTVGPIEWGLVGGDMRNTRSSTNAYSFSQTPYGRQARWKP